jgi:hypothetical protein
MRSAATSLILTCGVALAVLLSGCPQMARWRDRQIAQSQQIAQGQKVTPPAQPISVPKSVREELPLDDSFVITEYSASAGNREVTVAAISAWDTERTATWMISKLRDMGYDSGENPSEILTGVEYYNADRRYPRLTVKVTLNTADQCLVRLAAAKE